KTTSLSKRKRRNGQNSLSTLRNFLDQPRSGHDPRGRNHRRTTAMTTSTAARVHAFNQTAWSMPAQLRRLNQIAAEQPNRAAARLIISANLLACVWWLAKSEGVRCTCDILDACAPRLVEDEDAVLSFEP